MTRSLLAHTDPRGDVHPNVFVENGRFVVYFDNNTETERPDILNVYRTVVTADGQTLLKRQKARNIPRQPQIWTSERDEREVFWLKRLPKKEGEKPLMVRPTGDSADLGWGHSFAEADGQLFDLRIGYKASYAPCPLHFGVMKLADGRVSTVEIGRASHIFYNPTASRVHIVDGWAYVAWVGVRLLKPGEPDPGEIDGGRGFNEKLQLTLSRWKPGNLQVEHFRLQGDMEWNVDISINAIRDRMLIAWHTHKGTVKTRFLNLSETPFKTKFDDR